jgi:hypothetical protein
MKKNGMRWAYGAYGGEEWPTQDFDGKIGGKRIIWKT